jgi:glyoxylase-like metal-dependent hydrolase (beta-lactamase superfamily II)
LGIAQPRIDYSKLDIKTTDLGHGVYLLGWQGGDSLILVGDDGVLLVDTSVAQMGDKIKAAIAKVSSKPIELVINTHATPTTSAPTRLAGRRRHRRPRQPA